MEAKRHIRSSIVLFALSASLVSCVREEKPAVPVKPRNTTGVMLGANYTVQSYYDIESNTFVASNPRQAWSLAFETAPDGFHIFTNSGKNMYVYPTTKTDFASVKFSDRGDQLWDRSCGSPDSTAIGDWRKNGYVYIIDEGADDNEVAQGYSKIQVLSVDAQGYKVRVSKINNTHDVVLDIPKDTTYNLSFVLLGEDPKVVMIEPPKDTWDLQFTRYGFTFYDPFTCYMVVGCLSNRHNTLVAEDSSTSFEAITMANVSNYTFSNDLDAIGFDWKEVGSTTGGGSDYIVFDDKNYIIKTSSGNYFKLHFVGFYDENKIKGKPTWEVQRL